MQESVEKCPICTGSGVIKIDNSRCFFCNGTGEETPAGKAFLKNHTCMCISFDRKQCPVCGKKCHHSSTSKPKILVSPYM